MKQIVNVLVAAAFVCAAESAFAVVAARATRTVGAGVIEAKNVTLSNTVCEVGG